METHYKINPKDGRLLLVDQDLIQSQKGLIKEVIKTALKNFSFKEGFASFSLPIRIFKAQSHMDHFAMVFGNLQYIQKAHECINIEETDSTIINEQRLRRFKNVIAYILGGLIHVSASRKPFNHYLGETLQATFEDGTQLFIERVKHYKPTESFLFVNEDLGFKLHGTIEALGR